MADLRRTGDTAVTHGLAELNLSHRRQPTVTQEDRRSGAKVASHAVRRASASLTSDADGDDRDSHERASHASSEVTRQGVRGARRVAGGFAEVRGSLSGPARARQGATAPAGARAAFSPTSSSRSQAGRPVSGGLVAQRRRLATGVATPRMAGSAPVVAPVRVRATTRAANLVSQGVHVASGAVRALAVVAASKTAVIAIVVVTVIVGVMAVMSFLPSFAHEHERQAGLCAPGAPGAIVQVADFPAEAAGYSGQALHNAAVIMQTATDLGMNQHAQVIGLMVAIQESDLGRHPSTASPDANGDAGLFQQRQLPGWYGSLEQVNDAAYAARAFYAGVTATGPGSPGSAGGNGHLPGLADVDGWETMRPTLAANAVQRSRYPEAYARHEATARQLVAGLSGASVDATGAITCGAGLDTEATGTRKAVVDTALALLGTGIRYEMGAGGPNGPTRGATDCSGLTSYAWNAGAGLTFGRSAAQQWATLAAYRVHPSEIQPGDLLFYSYGRLGGRVDHVGMYIGDGQMIESISPSKPLVVGPARFTGASFVGIASPPAP